MSTAIAHRLDVPGASLHYEVRGSGPVLALIGLPMDGDGFAGIAAPLTEDHTVVTYDPRGIFRSTIDDPEQDNTPEVVADDVHRVLATVTSEPAFVFGSSGGAVTGLELVRRHPEQVRALVAHEPPLTDVLPDREEARAGVRDIYDTYRREGQGAAWPKFFAFAGLEPPAGTQEPPSAEQIATGERMLAHCILPTTAYRPDVDALRSAPTRVVIAGGADSRGQLAQRSAAALAQRLGTPLAEFPGGHGAFIDDSEAFARRLRELLA